MISVNLISRSSCNLFARLLHLGVDKSEWFDWASINEGAVPPFASIAQDDNSIRIVCSDGVTKTILKRVLTFLYTGQCVIIDPKDSVAETMVAAEMFGLDMLRNYCQNVLDGSTEFNPSIQVRC
jgi:hypothetical protein